MLWELCYAWDNASLTGTNTGIPITWLSPSFIVAYLVRERHYCYSFLGLPQMVLVTMTEIYFLQFWRPEVWNKNGGRAILSLKALIYLFVVSGEIPACCRVRSAYLLMSAKTLFQNEIKTWSSGWAWIWGQHSSTHDTPMYVLVYTAWPSVWHKISNH